MFSSQQATEDQCRDYLFSVRWPHGFLCPKCGCTEYYTVTSRGKYQCKACRYQASVIVGTVMERSHLPLKIWFQAIELLKNAADKYPVAQLSRELGIPYNTAWYLSRKIRKHQADTSSFFFTYA